ncbi:DUF3147 family protein [Tabrizicola sp.]|mgnify:FL=1|jgi:hypothetical protein|uniref:DUF3147 family protein n=1 Tax=Tabrizicola sp. TaxID=2005166 RepID=UPI001A3DE604|nr:DUF3147 family protein [Tabrizicola sp.]MBL9061646.1 DUF3147 family protein [Tabrizicola sp.]
MSYFVLKSILSGLLIAAISEIARRSPGVAALVASLPLVSILGVIWLWRDTGDTSRIASHFEATFWYVLPSLPMFLMVPRLMRDGHGFWVSLGLGCGLTIALYFFLLWLAPRFNLPL